MGVISDDALIKRAHQLLRPWVGEYPQTFESLLQAMSSRYTCTAECSGRPCANSFLAFLEKEMDLIVEKASHTANNGICDAEMRSVVKLKFLPCLRHAYNTPTKLFKWFELDFSGLHAAIATHT